MLLIANATPALNFFFLPFLFLFPLPVAAAAAAAARSATDKVDYETARGTQAKQEPFNVMQSWTVGTETQKHKGVRTYVEGRATK